MSKEQIKETKIPVPIPRVVMLASGQQVIAGITATEGSNFVRLHEPYKIRIHEAIVGKEQLGFVEEKMSLTPLVFQTIDKTYSVLRDQILTIGSPNKNLTEYYNNVRMGLFPSMKKEIEPIQSKMSVDQQFDEMMEKMNDEEYFDMLDYLRGNKKSH